MGLIKTQDLTLNPEEVKAASEFIVEGSFKKGRLNEMFDVHTGVRMKSQIVGAKKLGVGGGAPNGCTPKAVEGISTYQKYWTPALITGRLDYCAADINLLFKVMNKWSKINPDMFSNIPDDVMKLVVALMLEHIEASAIAKGSFSDTSADTVANGGIFSNTTDLSVFNQLDGIWKQIYGNANIPRYTISENAGADYNAQKITPDNALKAIEGVFDNAPELLKSDPDGVFYVSSPIFHAYRKKLVEIEGQGGFTDTLVAGRQALKYLGKTVVNVQDWTQVIIKYMNDGAKYHNPNLILFTPKWNVPFGTTAVEDLTNLENFYDKTAKKVFIDYAYMIDQKVIDDELVSVGY